MIFLERGRDMYFYQSVNFKSDHFDTRIYENIEHAPHLHENLEFSVMLEGTAVATVDGKDCLIEDGQFLLILPNQIHAYRTPISSRIFISVFSADYIPAFAEELDGRTAACPVFPLSAVMESYRKENGFLSTAFVRDKLLRTILYTDAARTYLHSDLVRASQDFGDFPHRVIETIEKRFREEDFCMKAAANALNYEYHYFSKRFSDIFHVDFRTFVNEYRLHEAKRLLDDKTRTVTAVAEQCGFGSLRNFNRVYLAHTGHTPRHR